jgi:hypothetical protein
MSIFVSMQKTERKRKKEKEVSEKRKITDFLNQETRREIELAIIYINNINVVYHRATYITERRKIFIYKKHLCYPR